MINKLGYNETSKTGGLELMYEKLQCLKLVCFLNIFIPNMSIKPWRKRSLQMTEEKSHFSLFGISPK